MDKELHGTGSCAFAVSIQHCKYFTVFVPMTQLHSVEQQNDVWSKIVGKIPSWTDPDISASQTPWGTATYRTIALHEIKQPSVWAQQPRMSDGSTRTDFFLVKFSGLIEVPHTGYWTFYLSVNDAGYVKVKGQQVVENYCCHMLSETSGTIELYANKYNLEVWQLFPVYTSFRRL